MGDTDANSEGDQIFKDTMAIVEPANTAEVYGVWNDQRRVKMNLNNDAMEEIRPYLEQGV